MFDDKYHRSDSTCRIRLKEIVKFKDRLVKRNNVQKFILIIIGASPGERCVLVSQIISAKQISHFYKNHNS